MEEQKNSRNLRPCVLALLGLLLTVVMTVVITYSLTSDHYLDQLDSQNIQIRTLQNSLRESNGLEPLEPLE